MNSIGISDLGWIDCKLEKGILNFSITRPPQDFSVIRLQLFRIGWGQWFNDDQSIEHILIDYF